MYINSKTILRFKSKILITDTCHLWVKSIKGGGYGCFWAGSKSYQAHRAAWILFVGNIPKGFYVCHKCDNKKCVNIQHLFLGTPKDNITDMMNKGRNKVFKGSLNGCSKLTENKVRKIRELYESGEYTLKELGEKFNIHLSNIHLIVKYKHWKHVE